MGGSTKEQNTNSTSTYTPNPQAGQAYSGAIDQAQQVAQTPFNYGTTQNVAGFTPQQQAAFNQVGQSQGMYAPYIDAASQYTGQGAAPITGDQIANYTNPYQSQVVQAALDQINHQNAVQQNQLVGNAAAQGALGGNRVGVAQAELARGQNANTNSTLAGLLSQGYNSALGSAQNDATRQLQAGNQMASYGNLAQNLNLQGIQALLGSGNQQQAQAQNVYNAGAANQQAATMWPYQNTQYLASILGALGPLMGGTQTGTSNTTQQTNPGFANYLGAGLAGFGALSADGGAVRDHYDSGGAVNPFGYNGGFWSQLRAANLIMPGLIQQPNLGGDADALKSGAEIGKQARAGISKLMGSLDPAKGWGATIEDSSNPDMGGDSGFLGDIGGTLSDYAGDIGSGISDAFGFADGGSTPSGPVIPRLQGSQYLAASSPGAAPESYYAPGLAALSTSRGPAPAPMPVPTSPGQSHSGKGTSGGLTGMTGGLSGLFSQHGFADGGDINPYGAIDGFYPDQQTDVTPFQTEEVPSAPAQADNAPFSLADLFGGDMASLTKPPLQATGSDAPVTDESAASTATAPAIQSGDISPSGGLMGGNSDADVTVDPLALIKREEGFAPTASWDIKQYSGGYGSKAEPGETFDEAKADAYLRRDAKAPLDWVSKNAPDATPAQKAALTSFGYNEGTGALDKLKGDISGGDWSKVADHMLLYNKSRDANGQLQYNPGLAARRQREADLINGGTFPTDNSGSKSPAAAVTQQAQSLVQKGMDPDAKQVDKGYANVADKQSGGLLKRLFGIEFNPLNLNEKERMALITAGLGMMASGNIGEGGLAGMQYLQQANASERQAQLAGQKLQIEMMKANPALHPNYKASGVTTQDGHPVLYDAKNPGVAVDAVTGQKLAPDAKIVGSKAGGILSQDDVDSIASRYVTSGNKNELSNLGQGNVGSTNRAQVQSAIRRIQQERGISDEEMANRQAEWEGRKAGQRSIGTMEAKMGTAANEAGQMIQLARGSIEKVPRTGFLPFNQLVQYAQKNTLNPDQAELYARTQAVVNTYSAVMARGANVTTDASRHRAEELLSTAMDKETYNRVLDTLQQEVDAAKNSPAKMREYYRQEYGKKAIAPDNGGSASAPAASAPAAKEDPLASARAAIAKGAPRDAVIKRLQDNGIDASGL